MTEPTVSQKTLARVRALLNKAFDPAATEAETASYEAKANALMASYGIDMAMLPDSGPARDKIISKTFTVTGQYAKDRMLLLFNIVTVFRCKSVKHRGKEIRITIVGYESDIERGEFLYDILQLQSLSAMRKAEMPYWETNRVRFNKSWLAGFTAEIANRLQAAEKQALSERAEIKGSGAELVLVDRKKAVEKYAEDALGKRRAGRKRNIGKSGYGAGLEAGARASLDQTQLGDRRARIGS